MNLKGINSGVSPASLSNRIGPVEDPGFALGDIAREIESDQAYNERDIEFLSSVRGRVAVAIERKQAEAALRESDARFRHMLDALPVAAYTCDANGLITYFNKAAVEAWGRVPKLNDPADRFSGSFRLWLPDGTPVAPDRCWTAVALSENRPLDGMEIIVERPDGTRRHVLVHANPMVDSSGRLTGAVTVLVDITDRKRAEEEMQMMRFSVDHAGDAVFWLSPEGRVLYVNESACQRLGYSRAELLAIAIFDLDPNYEPGVWTQHWQDLKQRGTLTFETWHRTKDGRVFPSEVNANYVHVGGQEFNFAFARDITERKRAEAELARLVAAVEQTADSIMITDIEGKIQYVNPAFERISGYSEAEVLGQNPRILKSGKTDPSVYRDLWQTVSGGEIWGGQLVNKRKDGTLFEERVTISPVRDNSGRIANYIAVKQDTTAQSHLEAQLRQSQKLEAIGQLAGGVAHDFNNLLTAIGGYTDLSLARVSPDDSIRHYLVEVRKAADRAASLTRQLLAFSRKQILEPKVLNLNAAVNDLYKMLRRLIGEDVELSTRLATDLGNVKVDPSQIEQIIMNLVVNARDAMPHGGKVTIETTNVYLDDEGAQEHVPAQTGPYVVLTISDTGKGMDAETQARIFEPFFTTKELAKGTGLGLSTVYGIVKQSGGFIWVYSELDLGTTFQVYLPRLPVGSEPEAPEISQPAHRCGTGTILLVEDEPIVRNITAQFLELAGFKVLESESGDKALAIARSYEREIQLVLTDVVMPLMGGRELAERLIIVRPEIRVLFMSGYTDDEIVRYGIMDKDIAFLQKPFTPESLVRKVCEILEAPAARRNARRGKPGERRGQPGY